MTGTSTVGGVGREYEPSGLGRKRNAVLDRGCFDSFKPNVCKRPIADIAAIDGARQYRSMADAERYAIVSLKMLAVVALASLAFGSALAGILTGDAMGTDALDAAVFFFGGFAPIAFMQGAAYQSGNWRSAIYAFSLAILIGFLMIVLPFSIALRSAGRQLGTLDWFAPALLYAMMTGIGFVRFIQTRPRDRS